MPISSNEMRAQLFETINSNYKICLYPGMACNNMPIRAHSIQNSRIIDLLSYKGHVKHISSKFNTDTEPVHVIEDIGRKNATTFFGLCSKHDTEIFSKIELMGFESENSEHLFLYAYRAVLKELYAVMSGASKLQLGLMKRSQIDKSKGHAFSKHAMIVLHRSMFAYQTYLYKCEFDKLYLARKFSELNHDVIILRNCKPMIAVNSLFSIDEMDNGDDCPRIALNVFPVSCDETVVVFSFTRRDTELARTYLSQLISSESFVQKYLLSKYILNSCENIIISPQHFAAWSNEKISIVLDYYEHTLLRSDLSVDNQELYLF